MKSKFFTLSLLLSTLALGWGRPQKLPANSGVAMLDTIYVDSTEVEYSKAFWSPEGSYYTLLLQADDTSSAGFASDSCAVKVEVLQAFNALDDSLIVMLPSRAHPDSTTYPFASEFVLFDSLCIADMDTGAVYVRHRQYKTNVNGDTVDWYYDDRPDTAVASKWGGFTYVHVPLDYSPAAITRLTGKLNNNKSGAGSRWIVRWFQQKAIKTKE